MYVFVVLRKSDGMRELSENKSQHFFPNRTIFIADKKHMCNLRLPNGFHQGGQFWDFLPQRLQLIIKRGA